MLDEFGELCDRLDVVVADVQMADTLVILHILQ